MFAAVQNSWVPTNQYQPWTTPGFHPGAFPVAHEAPPAYAQHWSHGAMAGFQAGYMMGMQMALLSQMMQMLQMMMQMQMQMGMGMGMANPHMGFASPFGPGCQCGMGSAYPPPYPAPPEPAWNCPAPTLPYPQRPPVMPLEERPISQWNLLGRRPQVACGGAGNDRFSRTCC